jgi:predicted RNase H-like HicB family nuclease
MQTTKTLRSIKCYRDGKGCWICEVSGEENLWTYAKTPEEALTEILALLEERKQEEREEEEEEEEEELEDYRPVGFSLDPGIPGPFGFPWRWILLPALILTLLLITWVVRSEPTAVVPTPSPVYHHYQWNPPSAQDLWRDIETERRLRELERRQSICSDPDLPPHLRDWCR